MRLLEGRDMEGTRSSAFGDVDKAESTMSTISLTGEGKGPAATAAAATIKEMVDDTSTFEFL